MFQRETADEDRIEQIILQSLRQILEHQDSARFLAWAGEAYPDFLGLSTEDLPADETRRLSVLLATAIWNATPLPASGFRPQPLATPAPSLPCPCGSGRSHKDCCAELEESPELPADLIWELLLGELAEHQLQRAVDANAVPDHLLAVAADRWLDQDRPRRAAALLEPLFEPLSTQTPGSLDERFCPALNVLCDAYDRLDHWKKKRDFLHRMTASDCRKLSAAAWQRLSTIHIDAGDFEEAKQAFTQAMRQVPDNPATALLEITLLAARHEYGIARQRAAFWHRRLSRNGAQEEATMDFLVRATKDPQEALVESQAAMIEPLLLRLRDWIGAAADRPLPTYSLAACRSADDPTQNGQLSLFDETNAGGEQYPFPSPAAAARLRPPKPLLRLEAEWHSLFDAPKPRSTQLAPLPLDGAVWEKGGWMELLTRDPATLDSLDILDDLATALYTHPESALPWIAHSALVPVLERGRDILELALPPSNRRSIPWSLAENRPGLRLLFRLYLFQEESGQETHAAATLATLLRLNPDDDHGIRAELMNHYLRRHEDEKALALAQRFPGDLLADLAYGEVLVLYRLGRKTDAERALTGAFGRLPRIPHFLTRKRVREPAIDSASMTVGGDDRAWFYRQAMRDVWEAEPGVLAWLKKRTA